MFFIVKISRISAKGEYEELPLQTSGILNKEHIQLKKNI